MPKKKTRGRKPMPGKLVCIKLDQQALRDSRALGRRWGTQTPATIRQSLRYAATYESETPEGCEGCGKPSTTRDSEGVPLCYKCAKDCAE